ncbi:ArsR/SmtB family transcription factor [Caldicellulosiruptoraceae bacterium PP1]
MDKEITNFEICNCTIIHEDVVKRVRENMVDENHVISLAEFFKVFGDATRIKIINALLTSEMCVCDIAALLGMSQSAISHQLRTLKQARLIKYRRDGKVVYYSLDDEHIKEIFDKGLIHVKE